MSGDASQDSESTKPEDSPDAAAISKKSAFTDEHDLDELPEEEEDEPATDSGDNERHGIDDSYVDA